MSLLTTKKAGLLPTLRSEFSELFDIDRFFDQPVMNFPFTETTRFSRIPATNIKEDDKEFIVELAAPGMKKKDFHVDIDNGVLEIKVENEEEIEKEEAKFTRREYNYNAFYRAFNLPKTVDGDKIKAEYEEGILKVHLPKTAEAKKKPIKEIAVT